MKTRIYIAIIVLILLAGIVIIYRSPPPDVPAVAATVKAQPVVAVVETVAGTVTAIATTQPIAAVVETDEATTTYTIVATATFTPSVSVNTAIPKQVVITPTNTVIPAPLIQKLALSSTFTS